MSNFVENYMKVHDLPEYIKAVIRYKVSAGPSLGESDREILHDHLVEAVKLFKKAKKELAKMTNTMRAKRQKLIDADIWSNLQDYISLQHVYEKLSQDDLSRLRLVSKEWNDAALYIVLPKNSFVTLITWTRNEGEHWHDHYLNGIVTYDTNNNALTFQNKERFRLRPKERHVPPFEVEGLIICHNMQERGVLNVHTQTWHVIPEAPNKSEEEISICGLIVDTTVKPFTFKLIEGFMDIATQIYDSHTKTWSITSSQLQQGDYEPNPVYDGEYTCVCRNGALYISVEENVVLKYSLLDDVWTTLEFPALDTPTEHNTLGVWESRICTVRESLEHKKIVDEEKEEWVEYARMPDELYEWMFTEHDFPFVEEEDHDEQCNYLRTFYRDGYVLFCFWTWYTASADALVLFNMATKEWRKADLPMMHYDPDVQYFEDYEYLYRSGHYEGHGVVEDDDEDGDAEDNEEGEEAKEIKDGVVEDDDEDGNAEDNEEGGEEAKEIEDGVVEDDDHGER